MKEPLSLIYFLEEAVDI